MFCLQWRSACGIARSLVITISATSKINTLTLTSLWQGECYRWSRGTIDGLGVTISSAADGPEGPTVSMTIRSKWLLDIDDGLVY